MFKYCKSGISHIAYCICINIFYFSGAILFRLLVFMEKYFWPSPSSADSLTVSGSEIPKVSGRNVAEIALKREISESPAYGMALLTLAKAMK